MTIPIEEWIKLVESGIDTPATIIPKGNSMWPLIRGGKDSIEVIPVDRTKDISSQVKVGDIVVFRREDGAFVVHRVWKYIKVLPGNIPADDEQKFYIQTYGDNCQKPDAPVPAEAVYGIATKIHRDDKTINPASRKALTVGKANRNLIKVRSRISQVKHSIIKVPLDEA